MHDQPAKATVIGIDYEGTFRFTRLFRSFRMAIHPSRLMLAMLLIVGCYIAGRMMDGVLGWGDDVVTAGQPMFEDNGQMVPMQNPEQGMIGEWDAYRLFGPAKFEKWRNEQIELLEKAASDENNADIEVIQVGGVFSQALRIKLHLFRNLVNAAIGGRIGFDQLDPATTIDERTVFGSLRLLTTTLPAWMWHSHRGFVVVWVLIVGLLWSFLGAAISRQMIVAAATDRVVPAADAMGFVVQRWPSYVGAPLAPLMVVFAAALALALGGVLFHVPILNVLAGLFYFVALLVGFVMALMLILWFAGVHLMYPAIGAEGTDALDSMARAFSYVLSRPWRMLGYTLIALVYGAATYVFVGLFVFVMSASAFWSANWFGGIDDLVTAPAVGQFPVIADGDLSASDNAAGVLILVWQYLLIGIVGAYAISFYFASFSQIYLLLRKYTDGAEPEEVFEPKQQTPPAEKVEPVAPAPATSEPAEPADNA